MVDIDQELPASAPAVKLKPPASADPYSRGLRWTAAASAVWSFLMIGYVYLDRHSDLIYWGKETPRLFLLGLLVPSLILNARNKNGSWAKFGLGVGQVGIGWLAVVVAMYVLDKLGHPAWTITQVAASIAAVLVTGGRWLYDRTR